jgi:hypothetical protein
MNLIIQKQEETIAQLQLAVEHYLESGDLETALAYSELFKLNCEAYKSLVGNTEVKEEKPAFRFGKQTAQRTFLPQENCLPNKQVTDELDRTRRQAQLNHENQMRIQYAQQPPQNTFVPQQAVVSQYSYGDGQDNPKIRANDANGNWGGNGEPNEIITPPQESIGRYVVNTPGDEDNLWGEDPRRNINNSFVPQ